jgi:hypothetical protein
MVPSTTIRESNSIGKQIALEDHGGDDGVFIEQEQDERYNSLMT